MYQNSIEFYSNFRSNRGFFLVSFNMYVHVDICVYVNAFSEENVKSEKLTINQFEFLEWQECCPAQIVAHLNESAHKAVDRHVKVQSSHFRLLWVFLRERSVSVLSLAPNSYLYFPPFFSFYGKFPILFLIKKLSCSLFPSSYLFSLFYGVKLFPLFSFLLPFLDSFSISHYFFIISLFSTSYFIFRFCEEIFYFPSISSQNNNNPYWFILLTLLYICYHLFFVPLLSCLVIPICYLYFCLFFLQSVINIFPILWPD